MCKWLKIFLTLLSEASIKYKEIFSWSTKKKSFNHDSWFRMDGKSPSFYIWADNFFILKSLWSPWQPPPIPGPPRTVHQLLLSDCPLLPLKAKDLQKGHSSGPKIFMGRTHYRNREWGWDNIKRGRPALSVCPKEGCHNGNEQMCF